MDGCNHIKQRQAWPVQERYKYYVEHFCILDVHFMVWSCVDLQKLGNLGAFCLILCLLRVSLPTLIASHLKPMQSLLYFERNDRHHHIDHHCLYHRVAYIAIPLRAIIVILAIKHRCNQWKPLEGFWQVSIRKKYNHTSIEKGQNKYTIRDRGILFRKRTETDPGNHFDRNSGQNFI